MSSPRESRLPRHRSRLAAIAVLAALLGLAGLSGGVWGLYTGSAASSGNQMVAAADWAAPTVTSSVIGKTQGGTPGFVHQGGTYNVYANASDSGGPASGVASVTGNLSTTTTGITAAQLPSGSYAIGATSYGFRSANLTANASLAAATYNYSLTSTDSVGNAHTQGGFSVIVDNTAPTAADIQAINKTGGTAGQPELGDTVIYTFSEPIDPSSVLAGWTGATTNAVVTIDDNLSGGNDQLSVQNPGSTTQLALGSVDLGHNNFVTTTTTYGAAGTASTVVQSGNTITVTLGTPSVAAKTAPAGTMIWSPSGSAFDRAGNAESTVARTETGTADKEF